MNCFESNSVEFQGEKCFLVKSFTKQDKLAWERNSKTAPMGVEILWKLRVIYLQPRKLKNTDATSHLHVDQGNIPSAAQISVVANKEIKTPQYINKNR